MTIPRHGGNPWALMEQRVVDGVEVIDFSADLNPMGPPSGLEAVLREAEQEVSLYPEPTYRGLCEALAEFEGTRPECILPGNGTAELIHLISRWSRPKRAVVVDPTFTEYRRAVTADGGTVAPCLLREEQEFSSGSLGNPEQLRGTQVLFLCNPNNPTGTLWPEAQLRRWLEVFQRSGILVVVDEAYIDFVRPERRASAVRWISEFSRLIVLRSMTKIFAVPGLRIGYLVASPELVSALSQAQAPWPVNSFAARAGVWLARQRATLHKSLREVERFKRQLETALREIPGLRLFPSEANFFLFRLTSPSASAAGVGRELAQQGLLVRCCDDFTGLEPDRFLRVAVRMPDENARLVSALREVLARAG